MEEVTCGSAFPDQFSRSEVCQPSQHSVLDVWPGRALHPLDRAGRINYMAGQVVCRSEIPAALWWEFPGVLCR